MQLTADLLDANHLVIALLVDGRCELSVHLVPRAVGFRGDLRTFSSRFFLRARGDALEVKSGKQ